MPNIAERASLAFALRACTSHLYWPPLSLHPVLCGRQIASREGGFFMLGELPGQWERRLVFQFEVVIQLPFTEHLLCARHGWAGAHCGV